MDEHDFLIRDDLKATASQERGPVRRFSKRRRTKVESTEGVSGKGQVCPGRGSARRPAHGVVTRHGTP